MLKSTRAYPVSSFGFVVLLLLFQRTYSSFSSITMEYQVALAAVSVFFWLVLLAAHRMHRLSLKALFIPACFFLTAAFLIQQSILLAEFYNWELLEYEHEIVLTSAGFFSIGYACYCLLWISAFGKNEPKDALIFIAASSGISALLAGLPPLLFGTGLTGNLTSFVIRIFILAFTLISLNSEIKAPIKYENESATSATAKEVWTTIKVIVISIIVARFVQGLMFFDESGYKEFGAQLIVIISPIVVVCIIALVLKHGARSAFLSSFYWALIMFASIMLLVPVAVVGSPIEFLWVLQFASFAQFDIAFFGILSSIQRLFGKPFYGLVCLSFCAKELAFLGGRLLRGILDVSIGNLICIILLIGFLVFSIAVSLLQSTRSSHEQEESLSFPQALAGLVAKNYKLTAREEDVLLLLLQGRSYTNIGHKLFISKSTVKTHANHIYAKMGVSSRDELVDLFDPANKALSQP